MRQSKKKDITNWQIYRHLMGQSLKQRKEISVTQPVKREEDFTKISGKEIQTLKRIPVQALQNSLSYNIWAINLAWYIKKN